MIDIEIQELRSLTSLDFWHKFDGMVFFFRVVGAGHKKALRRRRGRAAWMEIEVISYLDPAVNELEH